jgi:serine/threonine-protein kinase RsbW
MPEPSRVPDDRLTFHRRIDATPEAVRETLCELCHALSPLALPPGDTETIELVLAEALNNIVEHAYRGAADGSLEVAVKARTEGLHVWLCDEGSPMPGGHMPPGAYSGPGSSAAGVPEGGYGWFLIRALTRDLAYTRLDGRNLLSFRLDLAREGALA